MAGQSTDKQPRASGLELLLGDALAHDGRGAEAAHDGLQLLVHEVGARPRLVRQSLHLCSVAGFCERVSMKWSTWACSVAGFVNNVNMRPTTSDASASRHVHCGVVSPST